MLKFDRMWSKISMRYVGLAVLAATILITLHLSYSFYTAPVLYQPKTSYSFSMVGHNGPAPVAGDNNNNNNNNDNNNNNNGGGGGGPDNWEFVPERDADNFGLNQKQCRAAFPKLFVDIDNMVELRKDKKITVKELNSKPPKPAIVRAMIYSGEVCFVVSEASTLEGALS